jgi:hypothetical protein
VVYLLLNSFFKTCLKNMKNILSTDGGHGTRNDGDF